MSDTLESMQQAWKQLYAKDLPAAAKSKSSSQKIWPVSLDHCFARIILDNAIGKTVPWPNVLKSPAYKHMTMNQLRDAISCGNDILDGTSNLVDMDEKSLVLRNKQSKIASKKRQFSTTTQGAKEENEDSKTRRSPKRKKTTAAFQSEGVKQDDTVPPIPSTFAIDVVDSAADMTIFRKSVLRQIYAIPRGKWSTYQALSESLNSSPRAVGNALRSNPYAPHIPCHRVLASDGSIGGFGGHWGADGKFAAKKKKLLRDEGVRFDGTGKAVGRPYAFPK